MSSAPAPRSVYGTLLLPGDAARPPPSTPEGRGLQCELFVKNERGEDCVLIWVRDDGALASEHRFIPAGPSAHLESAYSYHSFVVLRTCADGYPTHLRDLHAEVVPLSFIMPMTLI